MRLLLRGGDVVDTEPEPVVHHGTDLLIEDGRITELGPDLAARAGPDAEVIDARGTFVLPGFVDTHRHVWQAALRGVAVDDDDLPSYLDLLMRQLAPRMRPEDVYTANLAGALECLAAGITTVQDYSHIQYTPQHSDAAVTALRDAGIRAVFGYGYPPFDPADPGHADLRRVRERYFAGTDGLLTMAFAAAPPSFVPIEQAQADWRMADELGLPIVVHIGSGPVEQRPIEALRRRGLLRPDTLYVHGNSLADEELALIAESGAAVSITPAVEAQMGQGAPMVNRLRAAGVPTGLGVDVVTTVAGDMFSVMRATLITSQLADGPQLPAADMLRLATLDGARALGLDERIGSLRPGKEADVVLLRADAPNLLATHDPVGSVVTAAHPGNVDTVLVGGRVVKRHGALLHPDLPAVAERVRASARHLTAPVP